MANQKNRLKKIRVSEISLVDKASVAVPGLNPGRNFLVYKRDADLTNEQESEVVDELAAIMLIEQALIKLKVEDPELFQELENNPDDFDFEETPSGFAIRKKAHTWKNLPAGRLTDPVTGLKPGETMSHKFNFETSRWEPKRSRDSWGKFR